MLWIHFLTSTVVIVLAGLKLTRYADELSERLDLGKAWIGVFLLGLITSLPEAFTSIWSIVGLKAHDLAIGNILGSNNFNPLILVLLDACYRDAVSEKIQNRASHEWGAKMVFYMSFLVFVELWFGQGSSWPKLGYITITNVLILGLYFWGMMGVYRRDKKVSQEADMIPEPVVEKQGVLKLSFKLFLASLFVIIGAVVLSNACDQIALVTGLGRTFIGTLLLALVTSLPEIVVSLSALRLGSFDMAVGNVVGSNMTNLFILVLCAFVTPAAPLLSIVSPVHVVALLSSLILLILVVFLMRYRGMEKRVLGLSGLSYVLIFVFGLSFWLIYSLRMNT